MPKRYSLKLEAHAPTRAELPDLLERAAQQEHACDGCCRIDRPNNAEHPPS